MSDSRLSLSQRNAIYHLIERLKMAPASFSLAQIKNTGGEEACRIAHDETGSHLEVRFRRGNPPCWVLEGWPHEGKPIRYVHNTWEVALNSVLAWLVLVKAEIDAPDLWAAIDAGRALLGEDGDETPFKADERVQIAQRLEAVETAIVEHFDVNAEQLSEIKRELRYLREKADSATKRDWKNIAFSIFAKIATHLALNPDKVRLYFALVEQHLGPAFRAISTIVKGLGTGG